MTEEKPKQEDSIQRVWQRVFVGLNKTLALSVGAVLGACVGKVVEVCFALLGSPFPHWVTILLNALGALFVCFLSIFDFLSNSLEVLRQLKREVRHESEKSEIQHKEHLRIRNELDNPIDPVPINKVVTIEKLPEEQQIGMGRKGTGE